MSVSADLDFCCNRILRGRPLWSRLSWLDMTTYERSTLNER
jgi:hypothetical protein